MPNEPNLGRCKDGDSRAGGGLKPDGWPSGWSGIGGIGEIGFVWAEVLPETMASLEEASRGKWRVSSAGPGSQAAQGTPYGVTTDPPAGSGPILRPFPGPLRVHP